MPVFSDGAVSLHPVVAQHSVLGGGHGDWRWGGCILVGSQSIVIAKVILTQTDGAVVAVSKYTMLSNLAYIEWMTDDFLKFLIL